VSLLLRLYLSEVDVCLQQGYELRSDPKTRFGLPAARPMSAIDGSLWQEVAKAGCNAYRKTLHGLSILKRLRRSSFPIDSSKKESCLSPHYFVPYSVIASIGIVR
jgi:hypothetical protein